MRRHIVWAAAAIFTFAGGAAQASTLAGRFEFISGKVLVVRPDGTERLARKGAPVNEHDTVVTGKNAMAQILMVDKAIIALRPDSRLDIAVYRFAAQHQDEKHAGRSVLDLLRGGLRAITGVIGHVNHGDDVIRTPNATIGIRGTDHDPMYIPAPAAGATPIGPPGTYDLVNTGATYIQNPHGRVDVSPNQVGFAGLGLGVKPELLQTIPSFMLPTPPIHNKGSKGSEKDEFGSLWPGVGEPLLTNYVFALSNPPSGAVIPVPTPEQISEPEPTPGPNPTPEPTSGPGPTPPPSTSPPPPPPPPPVSTSTNAAVAGDIDADGSVHTDGFTLSDTQANNFFNKQAAIQTNGYHFTHPGNDLIGSGSVAFQDSGTVTVNWGIYATGKISGDALSPNRPRTANYVQVMAAPATPDSVLPTLSGTYSNVVASAIVTGDGTIGGTMNSVHIVLSNGSLTAYSFNLTDGASRNWAAACSSCSNVSLSAFKGSGIALTGTGPGGDAVGSANGMPVGPSGKGVLSSFGLQSASQTVTGSFVATTK